MEKFYLQNELLEYEQPALKELRICASVILANTSEKSLGQDEGQSEEINQ